MFTGIVQSVCGVVTRVDDGGITRITLDLDGLAEGVELGASIAVNGTCITAVAVERTHVRFDLVRETVALSNLGELAEGDRVNVERSFRVGDEVGGHILSGHIACTATVSAIEADQGYRLIRLAIPVEWMPYLMLKGFVALNGASLTIAELDRDRATIAVSLIPETLARTTFANLQLGDRVNLEVDSNTQAVVDTVRAMLQDDSLIKSLMAAR